MGGLSLFGCQGALSRQLFQTRTRSFDLATKSIELGDSDLRGSEGGGSRPCQFLLETLPPPVGLRRRRFGPRIRRLGHTTIEVEVEKLHQQVLPRLWLVPEKARELTLR